MHSRYRLFLTLALIFAGFVAFGMAQQPVEAVRKERPVKTPLSNTATPKPLTPTATSTPLPPTATATSTPPLPPTTPTTNTPLPTPIASATTTVVPPPPALLFEDTFEVDGLANSTRWVPSFWYGDSSGSSAKNVVVQSFHRRSNVFVAGGYLHLRAVRENIYGCGGDPCKTYPYSSAVITTGRDGTNSGPAKFEFGQGYVEWRIKFPRGVGLWSGLVATEQWTPALTGIPFEVDTPEVLGKAPARAHLSIHDTANGHSTNAYDGPDFTADFHTFGLERLPGVLVWYVDGVERRRVANDPNATIPAYLFMDIQVGTPESWAGAPDGGTVFPAETLIDFVRVWDRRP
jgi:beta-glucanase (GH16 family)